MADTGYQFIYLLYLIWSRKASAIRREENMFAALRKKRLTKAVLDQNKINMEELLILEFFNKTMILLELAGYKMIITT